MEKDGIKYIRIILENCEVIKIDGKYIGYFLLDDIKKSVQIFGCNSFGTAWTAQLFAVEIHKDANRINEAFGEETSETIFERLQKYNDITSVEVVENDGPITKCFVRWDGFDENDNQTSVIGENGNLYIVVDKEAKAETLFKRYIDKKWMWLRDDWGE